MSYDRVQQETSSSRFVKWMLYLEMDVNAFHREDHYHAQIAAEIRAGNIGKHVKSNTMLLKFTKEGKKKQTMSDSKAAWGQITGASMGD